MRKNSWCPQIQDCCRGAICVCYSEPVRPGGHATCELYQIAIPDQEPKTDITYPEGVE